MRNAAITTAYKTHYDEVLSKCHSNPILFDRWGSDPSRLETQILCHKMGTKVPDTNKYEADGEIFGPHRWPYDPAGEATFSDPPIKYAIATRMKAIGTTWWDWKNKRSIGLGYDFDSLVGHASGVSDEQIEEISNIDVPWLEVVRSTRGSGRHLYIWFQEPYPKTENHTEHAALARSFIPLIARYTGLDIESNIDVCGGVMWIYHTEASENGYASLKKATQILTAEHVPPNWRDHLDVVTGKRNKVKVQGWTPEGETEGDELDEMTQAYSRVPLDEVHLKILEDLEATGHTSLWVHDHHLWQGHTGGLKQVFDDWAERGTPMRGLFETNSLDSDPGKQNCFARPKPDGAWDVYRFGEGVQEHPLWDRQGKFTHTTLNYPSTLKQICLACGGFEGPSEKQGYIFPSMGELKKALKILKSKITLPDKSAGRTLSLHFGAQKKIILVISKERGDNQSDFPYFVKTSRGWERWIKDAIETHDKEQEDETLWNELDTKLRALKIKGPRSSSFDSWVLKDVGDVWVSHPRENIKSYLSSLGFDKPDPLLGGAVFNSWLLVNRPFEPEYPGGRMWNRDAAQFIYKPIDLGEGEVPHHPHWDRLVEHCGCDLTEYIKNLEWCKAWGIESGGDYLTAWIACMFQHPFGKLPYLFMYGPQNSGKSSFHEAVNLLLTTGVVKADRALTSEQGYNGELVDAVLAVIDEVDISRAGSSVYNKLKEWTTGLTISIHAKYRTVQDVPSTLHFVQMANSRGSLPLFPGDTRITAMEVPELVDEIPRETFQEKLKEEAPHFMCTLLDYEIQPADGRLMLPVIETQGKLEAANSNTDDLEHFLDNYCHEVNGHAVKLIDFKQKFFETLEEYQQLEWKDRQIRNRLSERFPVGKSSRSNQVTIGNITFDPNAEPEKPYTKKGGELVK